MPPLFDLSLLPRPLCRFVVIADTHYMLDPGAQLLEFESRRHQTPRAAAALQQAAALAPDFVVHLGDLVQEYPETPAYATALDQALDQLKSCCPLPMYHVAGNHDVGDKPDPTMPTHPVSAAGLEAYHQRFGLSWYSFDRGPLHGIVLNSQILNTDLEAARTQRRWLEADLKAHADRRLFLFTHLPPYLDNPQEPHLGHYDNIGQPDRRWLLELIKQYTVEGLFAGHVHFSFTDQIGPTHYRVLPSTSFTRPGFCHLFAAAPPPERGRDDAAKLGFYLVYVYADRTDLHFIRTHGAEQVPQHRRLLVPLPAGRPTAGGLAVSLSHPLANRTQVPITFPSIIRQPVRNDYPLLSLLELGAAAVRVPWTDLEDDFQRQRLSLLRRQGVALHATGLWQADDDLAARLQAHGASVDHWEVQLPAGPIPPSACLAALTACSPGQRLSLAAVVAGHQVPGKQHPRTRIGFEAGELTALEDALALCDLTLDAALCRIEGDPWDAVRPLAALQLPHLKRLDTILALPAQDDGGCTAAAALFALPLLPNARLFLEPLIDLDRTMDGQVGLVDPLCNPRPAFAVVRHLHALLEDLKARGDLPATALSAQRHNSAAIDLLQLQAPRHSLILLLPKHSKASLAPLHDHLPSHAARSDTRAYALQTGYVQEGFASDGHLNGPTLLICPH